MARHEWVNPQQPVQLELDVTIEELPFGFKSALEQIAGFRECSPLQALIDTIYLQRSLDIIRDQGWTLLAEKNGDVRRLIEV